MLGHIEMDDLMFVFFFFFKQKTEYVMRISDWSSDVCSSDLVVVYIYTPLPDESRHESDRRRRPPVPMRDLDGRPVVFPKTAEEWAEPRWVDYACHADAPWLDDRLRQRIHDFV